ncbi:hypothetical protein N7492_006115 [Penicillium capsulatum]|uniref:Glycoside hydrolase family 43 protein n=1 Tax=Penicillium capsulatum TaxID=69766 RepID=A0A9W9LLE5_9EURO|nr:hypothetical protein N7492_006115 [Penicillium capsulatum]KAJ6108765.1 hypothetical protein N7512_008602 [Penicillium capsulatum]
MSAGILFSLASSMFFSGITAAQPTLGIDADFADPCVIQTDDGWDSFATGIEGINIQVAHSDGFSSWPLLDGHDAVPGPFPSWVAGAPGTWAPDVIRRVSRSTNIEIYGANGYHVDGTYIMYFSATSADDENKHCIGAASSSSITGPYRPQDGSLACPLGLDGAIDPSGFKDGDTYYVVYKIDGNSLNKEDGSTHPTPILLQGLDSDAMSPVGDSTPILERDDTDGPLIEALSLVKVGNTFYLAFSNMYDSKKYDVSFATSPALTGPYEKARDPDAPLLQSGDSRDGSKIVFHAFKNSKDINDGRAMYYADIHVEGSKISIV